MSDDPPWAGLPFEEPAAVFQGPTQYVRVWSEGWARRHLFCPRCDAATERCNYAGRGAYGLGFSHPPAARFQK